MDSLKVRFFRIAVVVSPAAILAVAFAGRGFP
jgi:hypothetical protein